MEECYYSHYILWHYFQLTKSGFFQILGKRKGQWKVIYKRKGYVDPIKYCDIYKKSGCANIDTTWCDVQKCNKLKKD